MILSLDSTSQHAYFIVDCRALRSTLLPIFIVPVDSLCCLRKSKLFRLLVTAPARANESTHIASH